MVLKERAMNHCLLFLAYFAKFESVHLHFRNYQMYCDSILHDHLKYSNCSFSLHWSITPPCTLHPPVFYTTLYFTYSPNLPLSHSPETSDNKRNFSVTK